MKLSIINFKSIDNLSNFELKPLTILSGNNSSGKSSFIQLLLLIKQSLDISSSKYQLFTNGELLKVKNQIDLILGKNKKNELFICIALEKKDFELFNGKIEKSLYDSFKNYQCNLKMAFSIVNNELVLNKYLLEYTTEIKTEYLRIEKLGSKNEIEVKSNNNAYFIISDFEKNEESTSEIKEVNYSSFFPLSFEEKITTPTIDPKGELGYTITQSITRLNNASIKSYLETFFSELQYIGPLREEPKDSYTTFPSKQCVGSKGEFTAQILELNKDVSIDFLEPQFKGDGIIFTKKKKKLLDAVNFWICKAFLFGKKLTVNEVGDSFVVYLTNNEGVDITLKHVGFGISQVLPIIVQGLLMKKGSTLILEQPEIHLHPKIQSLLFDFLYSLILDDKKVLVETHSDHLITRLRRRIAEDEESGLQKSINLTFVERTKKGLEFNEIKLNNLGIYNVFPEDFIENPETEMLALLDAQMKKRKSKRK